jgi:hypothetical protein
MKKPVLNEKQKRLLLNFWKKNSSNLLIRYI